MATRYALIVFDEVSSTQDEAASRAGGRPVLVVAARQTAGRGRLGRPWMNAPRALAVSLAVRPTDWPPAAYPRISLMAALAGRAVLGTDLTCKWPNDLVREDGKLAGLLSEATGDLVVVGMGVNLWWPDPPVGFAALYDRDPGAGAHVQLGEQWGEEMLRRLEGGPEAWGREEYRACCATLGRRIRWSPDGEGVAKDVDEGGRLVVDTPGGEERLSSGEVWEVR